MIFAVLSVLLLVLLGSGVWVAFALLGVAVAAVGLFTSRPLSDAMATSIWSGITPWSLTALPLFIWMGELLFRSRLTQDMFRALAPWLSPLPGRLLHVNVVGCTIFAAVSGSSAATCATVGRITYPELRGRGYPDVINIGSLAGAGTLGLLIPPSIMMIVYGVAADVSITDLFLAGFLPGLIVAGLFALYIAGWALLHPDQIPGGDVSMPLVEMVAALGSLWPIVLLIAAVLGSIYAGIATATEAAAIGVVGALCLSYLQGGLDMAGFRASLTGAVMTTAMITLILAGSSFLTLAMGYTGLPRNLANWVGQMGLSVYELLFALTLLYIVLGCFLDGISMVVLTLSVLLPTIKTAGIDLLWFGIYVILVVEMAQITPPVGFNLFVLQSLTGRSIGFVARAAFPFFLLLIVAIVLITLFPSIVTLVPNSIKS